MGRFSVPVDGSTCVLAELTFAENSWLDRLKKKLARSPQLAADAEEISAELDVSRGDHRLIFLRR